MPLLSQLSCFCARAFPKQLTVYEPICQHHRHPGPGALHGHVEWGAALENKGDGRWNWEWEWEWGAGKCLKCVVTCCWPKQLAPCATCSARA